MEGSTAAQRVTKRFIPGTSLDDMLRVCQELFQQKILATADRLGENVTTPGEAAAARDSSTEALTRLAALDIGASFSIKLTQFGLDLSTDECLSNVSGLVERARDLGTRIEIDMESTAYTQRTLDVITNLHSRFGSVRAVIQAYLHRTAADIAMLNEQGIPVRLCKGAYNEPASEAFPSKADVDANYIAQAKALLDQGTYPALATHDPKMIEAVLGHAKERGLAADRFEFQMLYGIRRDLQQQLVAQGYRLRLYVPYGDAWYPYFMRRLAERPANVFFIAKNLFRA